LPFASLPGQSRRILDGSTDARPGGTFTTFHMHAYRLPPAVAFRRDISRRMGAPRLPIRRDVESSRRVDVEESLKCSPRTMSSDAAPHGYMWNVDV
jgi:hypothetical protein